jgi:hypothetical protein
MALRIVFADPNAPAAYRARMRGVLSAVARASSTATRQTAKTIKQRGAADIAASGKFGVRWQDGLQVEAEPASGNFINNTITISHDQKGARNFEFGATIFGNPTLWIPLSFADPNASAKSFPGGLFQVTRKGGLPPLLLSVKDRKPKFVGKHSVTIPRKWHLRDIAADAMAKDFPKAYSDALDIPNG